MGRPREIHLLDRTMRTRESVITLIRRGRRQARRIKEACVTRADISSNDQDTSVPDFDTEIEDGPYGNVVLDDARVLEITLYLENHRQESALDNRHFQMGEHVLLSHLINISLNLRPEEFRAFLKHCSFIKKYFVYIDFRLRFFNQDACCERGRQS